MPAAKKTTKQKSDAQKPKKGALSSLAQSVALAPLMTEKTAMLAGSAVYAFRVAPDANRVAVRQAFKEMYGMLPLRVNIMRVHGKEKRFGRVLSRKTDWKKAYVALPAGTTLDLFATA